MGISRGAEGYREVYERIGAPSIRRQLADAWDFQVLCGPRLFPLLGGLMAAAAAAAMLLSLVPFGLMRWAAWRHGSIPLLDPLAWPLSFQLGILFGVFLVGIPLLFTIHLAHVAVQRVRRFGRYRWKSLGRDLGLSVERTIHVGTIPFCLIIPFPLLVLLFASHGIYVVGRMDLPPAGAAALAAAAFLFFFWLLVFHPLVYLFAILVRRDCGWIHAWDAAWELTRLESRGGLTKSAWCFLMIFSLVGIPGALALLLETAERYDLVLSAVLGEKTRAELDAALSEAEEWNHDVLQPFHDLIARGRYLDALNGFQQFLYRHPQDLEGWRGQTLAYLHMGHPKGRESLERWHSMEPESEEAAQLLQEYYSGLWSEGGERLAAAQSRCTQPLGQGF